MHDRGGAAAGAPDDDGALPDLAHLSIGERYDRVDSALLDDSALLASPAPSPIPLPLSSPPTTPARSLPSRSRAVAAPSSPFTFNLHVQAGSAPVTINAGAPTNADERHRAAPAPSMTRSQKPKVASGDGGGSPPPSPPSTAGALPYRVRGGGRVIPWNPALEIIEPRDSSHRKKWYVVIAGLRVGIWRSWLAMEDYIDVRGARFQSCETREEAERLYATAKREGRVRLLAKA
ncbi:hypothetical protein C8Q76DRAFT_772030 [Earliella scabrosa]|nr:hypothetical protein C8Q76DRAFT_772030 [Earliella scabrosa]